MPLLETLAEHELSKTYEWLQADPAELMASRSQTPATGGPGGTDLHHCLDHVLESTKLEVCRIL
jgi:hypothetical protein